MDAKRSHAIINASSVFIPVTGHWRIFLFVLSKVDNNARGTEMRAFTETPQGDKPLSFGSCNRDIHPLWVECELSGVGMVVVVPSLAPGKRGATVVAGGMGVRAPAMTDQRHQAAGPKCERHRNGPEECHSRASSRAGQVSACAGCGSPARCAYMWCRRRVTDQPGPVPEHPVTPTYHLWRQSCKVFLQVASFTYLTAQINATGTIAVRALSIQLEFGVCFGLLGILLCSMGCCMRGVTWTQAAQDIVLIIAYLIRISNEHSAFSHDEAAQRIA